MEAGVGLRQPPRPGPKPRPAVYFVKEDSKGGKDWYTLYSFCTMSI